ncbi:MAG: hypothetical protein WCF12_04245 [Propionicimonas sp.]
MTETPPAAPVIIKVPNRIYVALSVLSLAVTGLILTAILANQPPTGAVPPTPPALRTVSIYTSQNAPVTVIVTSSAGVSSQQTTEETMTRTLTDVPAGSAVQVQVAAYSQFDEDDIRVSCNIKVGDKALASQVSNGQQFNGTFPAATCIATVN